MHTELPKGYALVLLSVDNHWCYLAEVEIKDESFEYSTSEDLDESALFQDHDLAVNFGSEMVKKCISPDGDALFIGLKVEYVEGTDGETIIPKSFQKDLVKLCRSMKLFYH